MSETFYVVSKVSPDAEGYESALVFNATAEGIDNEAAANDYLAECKTLRPWQSHEVVSADDFSSAYDSPSDSAVLATD